MLLIACLLADGETSLPCVHTLEDIEPGQVVWRYVPSVDRVIPRATRAAMRPEMRRTIDALTAATAAAAPGREPLLLGHSADPNLDFSTPEIGVARRRIEAGEPLTADHAQFLGGGGAAE